MEESLKSKVSPYKFPTGYVWTTKFRNINFVDAEYKGYSKKVTRLWKCIGGYIPPCLDAEDYPVYYYNSEHCIVSDEQGNKFWN